MTLTHNTGRHWDTRSRFTEEEPGTLSRFQAGNLLFVSTSSSIPRRFPVGTSNYRKFTPILATCFVCDRMRNRKGIQHVNTTSSNHTQLCLLCNKYFCQAHGSDTQGVCEVNYTTYYRKHAGREGVYASLEARQKALNTVGIT
jgi:hypothetical protein